MLSETVDMAFDRFKKEPAVLDDWADTRLDGIIQIIVNDFNGDAMAYFNSIRPNFVALDQESRETEARIVHRFAKSV